MTTGDFVRRKNIMDDLNHRNQSKLPQSFKPFFWSYDFAKINPQKEKETVIIQTINYGDLDHWKWLRKYYGQDAIKKILLEIPVTAIKPRTRRLLSLIFDIDKKEFNYVPRSAKSGK
ncbi:MAG: hypothetical protein NTZ65_04675 [Candidatus Berkelbacteria bacterium]|nr:hypothetical protein [Candidatus Berkelbacteria bacterium]